MLHGSSWSTIRDVPDFDKGKHDVLVRLEHRLRCDNAQVPWDKLSKKGQR